MPLTAQFQRFEIKIQVLNGRVYLCADIVNIYEFRETHQRKQRSAQSHS